MWIFTSDSFLSVVAHRDKPDQLLVRSRIEGDIQRAIPEADVFEDPRADYRYRAVVPSEVFKAALNQAADRITYHNFKDSIKDSKRKHAAMDVWSVMANAYGAYGEGS
jgi:hypothetical protein